MRRKLEADLLAWRASKSRRPVLLFGARQVGKTHLLREFGRTSYDNVAYLNLETSRLATEYFADDISPRTLVPLLEAEIGVPIVPGHTLLILDEIQSSPRALTALKYFAEAAPEYHVAAAGSLLGVAVNRESQSYPVGNVVPLTLHPLDFEEFLWALGEERLADQIRTAFAAAEPLPIALHERALSLYRRYLVIGGMPRGVVEYTDSGSLLGVADIQRGVLHDYTADMVKCATAAEGVKIRAAYDSLPAQLAKDNHKFQYKLATRGGTAAIFGPAIDWLVYAGIALRCDRVTVGRVPLAAYRDLTGFKLYMGDVGLLGLASGMPSSVVLAGGSEMAFLGALTENYVAQALAANLVPRHYWASDGRAEVDFLIQAEDRLIPVEVKAGSRTRSRSLGVFTEQFEVAYSVRLSTKNFGYENAILSVPLYAAFCLTPVQLRNR
ncbi:MAG: ATP-binding protein [Propionibacteriaceae bacterium]|jgi:predicted AAA+ superfamily ATPase|nr:ATP-binding protein [Propionibacteriaceae bacterium]